MPRSKVKAIRINGLDLHAFLRWLTCIGVVLLTGVTRMVMHRFPLESESMISPIPMQRPQGRNETQYLTRARLMMLWRGDSSQLNVELVISHCDSEIWWIFNEYTIGVTVTKATVYSKCGKPVDGPSEKYTVVELPNVGRCDHSYAHWMEENVGSVAGPTVSELVVFMKDKDNKYRELNNARRRSLIHMGTLAAELGFACGEFSVRPISGPNSFPSSYHHFDTLKKFQLSSYGRENTVAIEDSGFKSSHANLGEWIEQLGFQVLPEEVVQVCYGGVFVTTREQIGKHKPEEFQAIKISLSRGDNIEENHFCERVWGSMLGKPLGEDKAKQLLKMSHAIDNESNAIGTLY